MANRVMRQMAVMSISDTSMAQSPILYRRLEGSLSRASAIDALPRLTDTAYAISQYPR